MKIVPSTYAEPIYTKNFYEADLWGGRGRSGSHNITLHALYMIITSNYFRAYFTRAIQNTIRESLWQDFKDRIEEVGDLNGIDLMKQFAIDESKMKAVYLPNGNTIKSKGFRASSKSNTANMKSLAGATHIYIEEAEEVGEEEYNKAKDSLRTIKNPVQIIRSWNAPPKDHWLVKTYFDLMPAGIDGYYRLKAKGIKGHLPLYANYLTNIKNLDPNTVANYKRYKETNPRYYYNQILGYVSDGGDAKVYFGWKKCSKKDFDEVDADQEAYGVDFGDTAPTAVIHIKYKDGCFYSRDVLYKSMRALKVEYQDKIRPEDVEGVEDNEHNQWLKHKGVLSYVFSLMNVDRNKPMFCDPAQKSIIIELRNAGYNAIRARKEKEANINFINRATNIYTEDSYNLEEEYNHYYLERDVNKVPIDGKPKKGNDHILEAREYGCRGIKDMLGLQL